MPWNVTTKIATAPLSIGDISKAVGITSGDLGTIIKSGGQSKLINRWAKNKPVRSANPGILTAAEKQAVNYGLNPPGLRTYIGQTLADEWVYLYPRGKGQGDNGENEWFRILDFDNYHGDAIQPIQNLIQNRNVHLASLGQGASYDMAGANVIINIAGGDSLIGISDLPGVSGYYLGAVFSNVDITTTQPSGSGTVLYYKTSENTIGSSSVTVPLTRGELETLLAAGIKYYYIAAFTVAATTLTQSINAGTRFRALPCEDVTSFKGQMNIDRIVLADASIKTVCVKDPSRIVSASDFIDATPYIGSIFDHGYLPTTAYHLSLGVQIKAPADTAVTIPCSTIRVSVDRSFADYPGPQSLSLYSIKDASFNDITTGTISLSKGQTKTIYLLFPAMIMAMNRNGSPQSGLAQRQLESMFTISSQYGQYNWPNAMMSLGLQNY